MGTNDIAAVPSPPAPAIPVQADGDEQLVALWLGGRPARTRRVYLAAAREFLDRAGKPLRAVTLGDVQDYAAALDGQADATRARKINTVKSLFGFARRLGYVPFDVGAAIKPPPVKQALAERILDEGQVLGMLALERDPRDRAILRLLYLGGLRISEACGLRVRDLRPNGEGGQVTVFGKGGRTRAVLLKAALWRELRALAEGRLPDAPLFRSARRRAGDGGPDADRMDPSAVHRVVKRAAERAGLPPDVSGHWLRHAHVSHALDRGAPAHLVQQTVGHASLATTSRYAHARPNDSSSRYLPG